MVIVLPGWCVVRLRALLLRLPSAHHVAEEGFGRRSVVNVIVGEYEDGARLKTLKI